eukprot:m51a1_g13823 hypothetical protein (1323) ;mRNA; r:438949-444357
MLSLSTSQLWLQQSLANVFASPEIERCRKCAAEGQADILIDRVELHGFRVACVEEWLFERRLPRAVLVPDAAPCCSPAAASAAACAAFPPARAGPSGPAAPAPPAVACVARLPEGHPCGAPPKTGSPASVLEARPTRHGYVLVLTAAAAAGAGLSLLPVASGDYERERAVIERASALRRLSCGESADPRAIAAMTEVFWLRYHAGAGGAQSAQQQQQQQQQHGADVDEAVRELVASVQRSLLLLNFLRHGAFSPGLFDSATSAAIARFERHANEQQGRAAAAAGEAGKLRPETVLELRASVEWAKQAAAAAGLADKLPQDTPNQATEELGEKCTAAWVLGVGHGENLLAFLGVRSKAGGARKKEVKLEVETSEEEEGEDEDADLKLEYGEWIALIEREKHERQLLEAEVQGLKAQTEKQAEDWTRLQSQYVELERDYWILKDEALERSKHHESMLETAEMQYNRLVRELGEANENLREAVTLAHSQTAKIRRLEEKLRELVKADRNIFLHIVMPMLLTCLLSILSWTIVAIGALSRGVSWAMGSKARNAGGSPLEQAQDYIKRQKETLTAIISNAQGQDSELLSHLGSPDPPAAHTSAAAALDTQGAAAPPHPRAGPSGGAEGAGRLKVVRRGEGAYETAASSAVASAPPPPPDQLEAERRDRVRAILRAFPYGLRVPELNAVYRAAHGQRLRLPPQELAEIDGVAYAPSGALVARGAREACDPGADSLRVAAVVRLAPRGLTAEQLPALVRAMWGPRATPACAAAAESAARCAPGVVVDAAGVARPDAASQQPGPQQQQQQTQQQRQYGGGRAAAMEADESLFSSPEAQLIVVGSPGRSLPGLAACARACATTRSAVHSAPATASTTRAFVDAFQAAGALGVRSPSLGALESPPPSPLGGLAAGAPTINRSTSFFTMQNPIAAQANPVGDGAAGVMFPVERCPRHLLGVTLEMTVDQRHPRPLYAVDGLLPRANRTNWGIRTTRDSVDAITAVLPPNLAGALLAQVQADAASGAPPATAVHVCVGQAPRVAYEDGRESSFHFDRCSVDTVARVADRLGHAAPLACCGDAAVAGSLCRARVVRFPGSPNAREVRFAVGQHVWGASELIFDVITRSLPPESCSVLVTGACTEAKAGFLRDVARLLSTLLNLRTVIVDNGWRISGGYGHTPLGTALHRSAGNAVAVSQEAAPISEVLRRATMEHRPNAFVLELETADDIDAVTAYASSSRIAFVASVHCEGLGDVLDNPIMSRLLGAVKPPPNRNRDLAFGAVVEFRGSECLIYHRTVEVVSALSQGAPYQLETRWIDTSMGFARVMSRFDSMH